MASIDNCGCSPEQVDLMFKKAEQYVDDQIADRTYMMNRYWVDLFPSKVFPDGAGLRLDKVRFFGDIGPQFDGMEGWRKVEISRNACEAALKGEHDGCGYNWEEMGHGLETVSYDLFQRDLKTKPICIKDIRTFYQYQEVQNLIFKNLTNISANMREQLNRNTAYSYAIKHVALPNLPINTADPRALPTIPSGVEVGKLTYQLLLSMYHPYAQEASMYSLANLNGMPMFGIIAHPETLHDMTYLDQNVRQDLRDCDGTSCDLIRRYNFLDGMGPFILMPDMYAPRYDRDVNGNLYRVFPYDRDMPIEIGTRPVTNPAYHTAEYELVLMMTRDLFSLRTRRPLTSAGGQTNFDAESPMFQWKWHNPPRECDPYRRVGRYVTTAEIGVEPGDFVDLPAILIKRKPGYTGIEYWGPEVCPPCTTETCNNTLPDQGCPCPQVTMVYPTITANELLVVFDRDTGVSAQETIEIDVVNDGGYISGTVQSVSTDGTQVVVQFAEAVCADPNYFVQLRCNPVSYCNAEVIGCADCRSAVTDAVTLILNRALKADTAQDVVVAYFGDGTTANMSVVSADPSTMEWVVQYATGFGPTDDPDGDTNTPLTYDIICDRKGITYLCVPPTTDESCPECGVVFEACGDTTASIPTDCCPCGTDTIVPEEQPD